MEVWNFILAALCLSVERICYAWVWRFPEDLLPHLRVALDAFPRRPIDVLRKLSVGFKGIQLAVFFGWCYLYGEGSHTPLTNASG